MNRLLYWWYRRKADKYLMNRQMRLTFMQMFDDIPKEKVLAWTNLFHDDYIREIYKLKKKYNIK